MSSSTKQTTKREEDGKKDIPEPVYGVGNCQPSSLQCLANTKVFTGNLGIVVLLQVSIFSYYIGIVRTLEKRFGLTSKQTGIINITNDVVQVVVVLTIGYLARKAHKPRFLSVSLIVLAVGCFTYAIPYFVFGSKETIVSQSTTPRNLTSAQEDLVCRIGDTDEDITCRKGTQQLVESNHAAFVIFIIAALLVGFGGAGLQVMGISYIDENVKTEEASIYLGVATAMYPLGPILGFLVAAGVTSLPENLKHSLLDKEDQAFIGAWWLGYAIFPCILALFSIPLFFFPKHFPEYFRQKLVRRRSTATKNKNVDGTKAEPAKGSNSVKGAILLQIKEFPKCFWRLLKKPEFITNVFGNVFLIYMIVGLGINMTRYMEIAFLQPAFVANIITAVAGALSGVVGNLLGGIIMRKLRLRVMGAALMHCITAFISLVGVAILMLVTCPQVEMAGEFNDQGLLDVDLPCKSNCTCSQDLFLPVCGEIPGDNQEKMTFLSPCHAGCQSLNGTWRFVNCSCLASPLTETTRGVCHPPCKVVYTYAIVLFFLSMVLALGRVPSTIVNLRVVDPDLRSFALGFQSFIFNLLAFIPGPIVFGALTDSACLIWSKNCDTTGNCLFYDTKKYRLLIHGVTLALMCIGFLFIVLTWYLIRRNTEKGVYDIIDKQLSSSLDIMAEAKEDTADENEANRQNALKEELSQQDALCLNNNVLSDTRL